jgi:hypothetical protein
MYEPTMERSAKDLEKPFLERISEYLVTLPFDLKILQEAVTDPDLDRKCREIAAGTIIHTILPQEGESPQRYVDDVLFVRAALHRIANENSEGAKAFKERFASEVYDRLEDDIHVFAGALGDLWPWLESKLDTFGRQMLKGKRPQQCLDDEEAASFLYEEGLEFQTNYSVDEAQVRNKVRRFDAILELLQKRRAEEAKKIS